jgi:hypothetical protein
MLLVPLTVVLAACGEWELTQNADLDVNVSPSRVEYQVDVQGPDSDGQFSVTFITADPPLVSAQATPGSLGVFLEGVSMSYFFADGTPVIQGDNTYVTAASVFVAPGLVCDDELGEGEVCTVNSTNARPATGSRTEFTSPTAVPSQVAYRLFCDARTNVGAYARMTLFGVDTLRRDFEIVVPKVDIVAQGDFLPPEFSALRQFICTPGNTVVGGGGSGSNSPPEETFNIIDVAAGRQTAISVDDIAEDPDNDALSAVSVASQAIRGRVVVINSATIGYTPNTGVTSGLDFFTISVSDGTETVDIDVTVSISNSSTQSLQINLREVAQP